MDTSKVWYVTGASQGLGMALVKKLLETGHRVAATSRNIQSLKKGVGLVDSDHFLPMAVDLNNPDSIEDSIHQSLVAFGSVDVVVNNAGYGMAGTVEEFTETDIRNIFDVNVLAGINVVKKVLPLLRKQRSGFIINIGSVAGFVGAPGWSVYSATKAAIAAFSEVLYLDVKEFGIKVTVVEPSGFRTGFLSENSLAYTETMIDGYEAVRETQKRYLAGDGRQPGDPQIASSIIMELVDHDDPPLHLYLGQDAYIRASGKITAMRAELEQWKSISVSADYK